MVSTTPFSVSSLQPCNTISGITQKHLGTEKKKKSIQFSGI